MAGTIHANRALVAVQSLAELSTLGWVTAPSPLVEAAGLAELCGLDSLLLKRDDQLGALHGGTKARKLDLLLAEPRFRSAERWATGGALGSSHLAACSAAAHLRGVGLDAHIFLEPLSAGVLENLAAIARPSTRITVYSSRSELLWRRPELFFRDALADMPVIPFGGTSPPGIVAIARAALEVAAQLHEQDLPPPDVIYCPLGTGGVASGLALGFGLAGLSCEIRAVRVVEWPLASALRLSRLLAVTVAWLAKQGLSPDTLRPRPIRVLGGQVGAGYGEATAASLAATEVLRRHEVPGEPVYTGKAFAALMAEAQKLRRGASARGRAPRRVLFWQTAHATSIPCDPNWHDYLPDRLKTFLARSTTPSRTRRRVVLGAAAALLVGGAVGRFTGYPELSGWRGTVLASWEAHVLVAATPVVSGVRGVAGEVVAANVDRFVASLPAAKQAEVHQLLVLIEHGTTPLGSWWSRFTNLAPDARDAYLVSLRARGGLLAQAYRGLRDLVMLGVYQDSASWRGVGYGGPLVTTSAPAFLGDDLSAPRGARPRATLEGE